MATGDKLVNLDDLKVSHDKNQGDISDLKSALSNSNGRIILSDDLQSALIQEVDHYKQVQASFISTLVNIVLTQSSGGNHIEIAVEEGEIYLVSGFVFDTTYLPLIICTDSSNNVIRIAGNESTSAKTDYLFIVPHGATKMYINGNGATSGTGAPVAKKAVMKWTEAISEAVIQCPVSNVFDPESAIVGQYCNAQGQIVTNEKTAYYRIDVKNNDILYFKNFDFDTFGNTLGWVFDSSDSPKRLLSSSQANGSITIIDPDASYALINCSNKTLLNFMLFKNEEYTGQSYVPHDGSAFAKNVYFAKGSTLFANKSLGEFRNQLLNYDFIDNCYVNNSGELITETQSAIRFRVYKIPVEYGDVLYFSGKFDRDINLALISTFNNGTFVKNYLTRPTNSPRTYVDIPFVVPDGVDYIYYNLTKDYTDLSACKVQILSNELINRHWTIIGDSISVSKGHAHQLYHDLIALETGITVKNLAKAGMGYKNGDDNFYTQAQSVPTDCDIVTIMGSINDGPYTLGTKDDTGTDTIGGCINQTITNIYARKPNAHIGLITPTPTESNMPWDTTCFLSRLSDLIIAVARKRGIPYLDLFHCSNLRPNNAEFSEICFVDDTGGAADPTHPNTEGHKMIYHMIMEFIKSL